MIRSACLMYREQLKEVARSKELLPTHSIPAPMLANFLTYSIIVPVYNRPHEVEELLESLVHQSYTDFQVVIVEDGSSIPCDKVVDAYRSKLNISYFTKTNSGPGTTRNYGFERAEGNYCIFLDSDCVLPPQYMKTVVENLKENYTDAFGGPDKAHESFSLLQKAINYSMTSFFTTGGIRGGGEKLDKFYPRSFNMGYSREVFESTKGFAKMRFGEDIDMSLRILENGYSTRLFKDAYVYHKRRTNLRQFFKQVFNSGLARINLFKRHPESLKLVHLAPAIFTIGLAFLVFLSIVESSWFLLPVAAHMALIFIDSTIQNRCIRVGFLSILSSYTQLIAYGLGFLKAFWKRIILKQDEFAAFEKNFYR